MIALPWLTISLDHILIDPNPSGAISIVNDDQDGRRRDNRDSALDQFVFLANEIFANEKNCPLTKH